MSIKNSITVVAILLLLSLPACGREQSEKVPPAGTPPATVAPTIVTPGCQTCHPFVIAGSHGALTCTSCHNGDDQTAEVSRAHLGLLAHPAHPANMQDKCGGCHNQTISAPTTSHFTLKNETNLVRRHFGAGHDLQTLRDIPETAKPTSPLQLADDLLRRRCLRCHVYYGGDGYSQTQHGTGCAACHLAYQDGRLVSHEFLAKPTDRQCLNCHYGNRVGSDYYGRFDHDFKQEYRTPYQPDGSYAPRPYAVEQHQLSPDIHQQAGMTCSDCHLAMHAGDAMTTISCEACHLPSPAQPPPAAHLRRESGKLFLTTRQEGLQLPVPPATQPLHSQYRKKVACTVCHAQWSFNDQNTALLRIDHDDYEAWDELFVQDSSEVEVLLLNGIYGYELLPPVMSDKITGLEKPGLWLKGFKIRRWESPVIAFDQTGRLQVMRPVLDLQLSWVDGEGKTVFNSLSGQGNHFRPYTPHTIGKAGAFYRQRLIEFLPPKPLGKKLK